MNKKELYLHNKYIAFVNHFKKVADPDGLIWYLQTGRLSGSDVKEILETIGDEHSYTSKLMLISALESYAKCDIETGIESKPKVNKQLKEMAEKYANMIYPRYALYSPKPVVE